MKIVRALWGNNTQTLSEIPLQPLFPDEIVFVWGVDNFDYLQRLGYNIIKVGLEETYKDYNLRFYHKLEALILADELFEEYLFLDWDVEINKPIDDTFIKYLKEGSSLQCPLYSDYSKNYVVESINKMRKNGISDPRFDKYVRGIEKHLKKYSWELENYFVLPNFSFFYSRNLNIGKKLMSICKENNISTNVEEFALYKYVNCSLNYYIDNHSPVVLYGNERLPNELKDYIDQRKVKDLYLKHDV